MCFSPLKAHYETFLTEFVHPAGHSQKLTKPAFCNLIASIWKKGLVVENVISGFKNSGTFPFDVNKYKISCLDKVKLKNYNLWKTNGAPVDEDESSLLTTENESDQTTLVNTSAVDSSPELFHYFICCGCSLFHLLLDRVIIQKLSKAAAYVQLQFRKIKDNHAAHNHDPVH